MASTRTREKVALVVFGLLIVGASIALVTYFFAARNLNVAANQVDDTLGMMDDYTVIIYPGTIPSAEAAALPTDEAPAAADGDEEALAEHAAETSVEGIEEALDAGESAGKPLTVADVFRQYSLKGASVLSLDDADVALYRTPKLFAVGSRTTGVFSIERYQSKTRLAPTMDALRAQGADIICLLAPDASMVGAESLATIVLTTEPDSDSAAPSLGSTFVASAAPVGDVGVIAISSSNILSSAVIEG